MAVRVAHFRHMVRRFSPQLRIRARTLKTFADTMSFVHFGMVSQHDDDYDAIRGFTASITHLDHDYIVGTFEGYNFRIVDRFDSYKHGTHSHEQLWCIMEIDLQTNTLPQLFLAPTGREEGEYDKVSTAFPHLQHINDSVLSNNAVELHGRYQILARPTHIADIEQVLTPAVITGIATRFWPHGLELNDGKLYLYITQHRLTKTVLESSLASGLWLAEMLDGSKV